MWMIKPGATDQTIYVRLRDSSTGLAKTGLAYNSAGASAYYVRNRGSATQIALASLGAANSAHSDGGFIEVDATNTKGLYRLDLPDAVVAAGTPSVTVSVEFDGIVEESTLIQLAPPVNAHSISDSSTAADNAETVFDTDFATNYSTANDKWQTEADVTAVSGDATAADNLELACDNYSATRGLSGTALPAAAADAAGGLPISDVGGLDMDAMSGITLSGQASAGSLTTITLTGGVATDNYYSGQIVKINAGTGIGQSRTILSYAAGTAIATVTRDWAIAPDNTSVFSVHMGDYPAILEAGTATAGGSATIDLDANAAAVNNTYKSNFIVITGGTGIGQTRLITAYNGSTKQANVVPNWVTNPAAGSIYQVIPNGQVNVGEWLGETVTLSAGNLPDVNIAEISDDSTAANNLELALENGTAGYVASDMKYLDGTAQSATDLKDFADAGYDPATNKVQGVVLVDTTTTNTDMRGTDSAALAATALTDATWTDARAGYLDELAAANIPADIDAILEDTNELQTDWADGGRLDLLLDAVNSAVVGAISEITAASDIPATPTVKQALILLYMRERNNSQTTATERRILNDAGTEILDATISDDGTTFAPGKLGDA
jgi:hypothetical protein